MFYILAPRMDLDLQATADDLILVSINQTIFITQAVEKALPITLTCSLIISVICSYILTRGIVIPIQTISSTTERMKTLDKTANCSIYSKDEIGQLAANINGLYRSLLSTIEYLEQEKERVNELERSKADFLQAASHELKTPVTALNATMENMILGVGRYQDYATCLPECKEMVEQISAMIHDILEASKMNAEICQEIPLEVDLSEMMHELCEPYRLIASSHNVNFSLTLPGVFLIKIPAKRFGKALSNIIANAIAYTEAGKSVKVYIIGNDLVIENECVPIDPVEIPQLFEPFYRPDFSRSRDSGGNGLGLYIVKTIFAALNVSYSFEPMEHPKGMRFTIRLI